MPEDIAERYEDYLDRLPMEELVAEGIVQSALALTEQSTYEFALKRVDMILHVINERIA